MKADHLIQAHQILADWQNVDADSDRRNAFSLVSLSVAPKLTVIELHERKAMLDAIRQRQMTRLTTAVELFVEQGASATNLHTLLSVSADLHSTLSLAALMNHFVSPKQD